MYCNWKCYPCSKCDQLLAFLHLVFLTGRFVFNFQVYHFLLTSSWDEFLLELDFQHTQIFLTHLSEHNFQQRNNINSLLQLECQTFFITFIQTFETWYSSAWNHDLGANLDLHKSLECEKSDIQESVIYSIWMVVQKLAYPISCQRVFCFCLSSFLKRLLTFC